MPSSKPILGVNDLQSQYPEIAAEAYGWDPEIVFAKSGQKKDWKCNKGHIFFLWLPIAPTKGMDVLYVLDGKY